MNPATLLLKETNFSLVRFVHIKFIHSQSDRSTRGFLQRCASHNLFSSGNMLLVDSIPLLQTRTTEKTQSLFRLAGASFENF